MTLTRDAFGSRSPQGTARSTARTACLPDCFSPPLPAKRSLYGVSFLYILSVVSVRVCTCISMSMLSVRDSVRSGSRNGFLNLFTKRIQHNTIGEYCTWHDTRVVYRLAPARYMPARAPAASCDFADASIATTALTYRSGMRPASKPRWRSASRALGTARPTDRPRERADIGKGGSFSQCALSGPSQTQPNKQKPASRSS